MKNPPQRQPNGSEISKKGEAMRPFFERDEPQKTGQTIIFSPETNNS